MFISREPIRMMQCVSISPSGIAIYKEPLVKRIRLHDEVEFWNDSTLETQASQAEVKVKPVTKERFKHNGVMSSHSQRKMKRALEWLLLISRDKRVWCHSSKRFVKFKVCFATLTLPSEQRDSDQAVKSKCLNSLLTELRKFHGLRNYVWRAEKQANGNIHFHLVMDKFIEASVLRRRWNRICNTLGYVTEFSDRMRREIHSFSDYYNRFIDQGSYSTLMRRYHQGRASNWSDPNSTDIHSVKRVRNLIAYLFKYMSKNIDNIDELSETDRDKLLVSGQLWGLSESLSRMKSVTVAIGSQALDEIERLWDNVKSFVKVDEWFIYKSCSIKAMIANDCRYLLHCIYERLIEVFGICDIGLL